MLPENTRRASRSGASVAVQAKGDFFEMSQDFLYKLSHNLGVL